MYAIRTILFPTDFSEESSHVFQVASTLAHDLHARLLVLHVIEQPVAIGEAGMTIPLPEGYRERVEQQIRDITAPDLDFPIQHIVEEGPPVTEILRIAEEQHVDLIIMSTHGRTGLGRLLMGSVAEQVLRRSACPVMAVRGATSRLITEAETGAATAGASS